MAGAAAAPEELATGRERAELGEAIPGAAWEGFLSRMGYVSILESSDLKCQRYLYSEFRLLNIWCQVETRSSMPLSHVFGTFGGTPDVEFGSVLGTVLGGFPLAIACGGGSDMGISG
jgi:hypothetical protein